MPGGDSSSQEHSSSGGEDVSGTQPKGKTPQRRSGGTVLTIGQSVSGRPSLVRSLQGKEIDFWAQVTSLKVTALEDVLALAKVDSAYSMKEFIDGVSYQGFDRELYIEAALKKISVKHFCQFAVLGALRGSNFQKIKDTSPNMPSDLSSAFDTAGFIKKPKKKEDLTILRCTASIPHWCAYWLLKSDVPKKLPNEQCPSLIQFPGAASIPMSKQNRLDHLQFCQSFSTILPGGDFNINIYATAYNNMIPLDKVPVEVQTALGAFSMAEALQVTTQEMHEKYGTQLVRRR